MDGWLESQLAAVAVALGARDVPPWSPEEEQLCRDLPVVPRQTVDGFRDAILQGKDPLGEMFCYLRSPVQRRDLGATYTPKRIVDAMLQWAKQHGSLNRVVDPGVGSGRFAVAAGRCFPEAEIFAIDVDPLATAIARGHLAAAGFATRARVLLADYRSVELPAGHGRTLFVGNPPYVRHHQIEFEWKDWLAHEARRLKLNVSQLAGLHVHFFLATALKARPGDVGCFITSAEWLDVNYGRLVRELFLGKLGGQSIIVLEPTVLPFPDAAVTGAITTFEVGSKTTSVQLKRVATLDKLSLDGGRLVRRKRLEAQCRWSHFTRGPQERRQGFVELGELCRVHRGQVTGANKVWIEGPHSRELPESVFFPSVTRARELFDAGRILSDASRLKRVIDLPVDLAVLDEEERAAVDRFLKQARALGADTGYIARYRKAWWSVGLKAPAPILATYMARRPPAFVRNLAGAHHLNIAHGLYPRESFCENVLTALVNYLSEQVLVRDGRTYAGGLTKFEPREMERLLVPGPELLGSSAA